MMDISRPAMTDSGAIDQYIMMFKLIASILILIQVFTVSLISTRLRGGGLTSALGQTIKLTWIAAITSLLTSYVLDSSSGLFPFKERKAKSSSHF